MNPPLPSLGVNPALDEAILAAIGRAGAVVQRCIENSVHTTIHIIQYSYMSYLYIFIYMYVYTRCELLFLEQQQQRYCTSFEKDMLEEYN